MTTAKKELLAKIAELQRAVDALPDEPKADEAWPRVGDAVFYATSDCAVDSAKKLRCVVGFVESLQENNNAFRSRKEAEREARLTATWRKLRKASRESLAKAKDLEAEEIFMLVCWSKGIRVSATEFYSPLTLSADGGFYFLKGDGEAAIASIGEAAIIELLTDGREG